MTEHRIHVRANEEEKKLLEKAATNRDMTISDYIKYRVFHNNPEISTENAIYEGPSKDRHNFLTMAVLHDVYWMIYQFLSEDKSDEEKKEFRNNLKMKTKNTITNYGYLRINKDE
jgi:hypothetical protein